MWWSYFLLLTVFLYHVHCDVNVHTPRCSNNRLDGNRRERKTNNRIFDSQNNNRNGYNVGGPDDRKQKLTEIYEKAQTKNEAGVRAEMEEDEGPSGKMKYYEGSILHTTWTQQHGCGGPNSNCEIIIQYMCSDNLRDGIENERIPENVNECHIGEDGKTRSCDTDRRYGMHEDSRYYALCKNTKRNRGLFKADQNLNGPTAKHTRQNRQGNRNGYECPEERDYYPYWRPTPWIDIAVMTNNISRCEEYRRQSENVAPRFYCKVPEEYIQNLFKSRRKGSPIPITEDECKNFLHNGVTGQWVQDSRTTHPAPECLPSPKSRDNHHGNGPDGFFTSYNWTIPNQPHKHCALRLRYNISTAETEWTKTHHIAESDVLKKVKKMDLRCSGVTRCCTNKKPCNAYEGDCDVSHHCKKGLICGKRNSPRYFWEAICMPIRCPEMNMAYSHKRDYSRSGISSWQACLNLCKQRRSCHAWTYEAPLKVCKLTNAHFSNKRRYQKDFISGTKDCQFTMSVFRANAGFKTIRCNSMKNCCTEETPCSYGEGDCRYDSDCKGTLICGRNNCPLGFRKGSDCCTDVNGIPPLIGADASETKGRGFALRNDPLVQPLKLYDDDGTDVGKLLKLRLAINTAQFGRTFEDRSHEFSILERPAGLKNKKIYNMEVRGKRGNIVQVYPNTEYDFTPNRLEVEKDDYIHIQWTGSDRNPPNNEGSGKRGSDRSNVLLLAEQAYPEGTPGVAVPLNMKHGHFGRNYPANLINDDGKTFLGLSREDRQKLALSDDLPLLPLSELLSSKDAKNVVSDGQERMRLRCGDGEVIRITSAYYGPKCVLNTVCSKCTGFRSMTYLTGTCNGKTTCVVSARRNARRNCDANERLHVSYKCIKASSVSSYLQLNPASHYFNLEPKRLSTVGEFKYMCSRNNDFSTRSHRSQKGKIKVSNATVSASAIKDSRTKDFGSKSHNKWDELIDELNHLELMVEA